LAAGAVASLAKLGAAEALPVVLERMNTGLARDGRRIVGEPDGYYLLVEVPVEVVAAKERGFVSNALRWLGSLDAEAALVVLPQLLVDEETVANYQRKLFWGLADTADERAAGPLARALNRLEGVGHCYTGFQLYQHMVFGSP